MLTTLKVGKIVALALPAHARMAPDPQRGPCLFVELTMKSHSMFTSVLGFLARTADSKAKAESIAIAEQSLSARSRFHIRFAMGCSRPPDKQVSTACFGSLE